MFVCKFYLRVVQVDVFEFTFYV